MAVDHLQKAAAAAARVLPEVEEEPGNLEAAEELGLQQVVAVEVIEAYRKAQLSEPSRRRSNSQNDPSVKVGVENEDRVFSRSELFRSVRRCRNRKNKMPIFDELWILISDFMPLILQRTNQTMPAINSYVKLAESLPPRLLRFFTRYQPQRAASLTIGLSTSDSPTQSNEKSSVQGLLEPSSLPNPFKSQKHPVTGRWQEPIYSLRRQAVLVKLARAHGVEELLPPTVKGTEARIQTRAEHGLRVKGTGVGQRVKGKKWERTLKGKLQRRKQAMLEMPKMIRDWKKVS